MLSRRSAVVITVALVSSDIPNIGAIGIHRYTEAQSVATQRLVPIAPMFGMSEETNAKVLTASLRLLNKLGRA